MIDIVCYTGGACGDLVAAILDPRDAKFKNTTVVHADSRIRLKKPHLFANDADKDQYLSEISLQYAAVPSHDLDYHARQKHKFIGITVSDWKTAMWAAERFKRLHRPQVWQEMQEKCGARDVEGYAQMMIDFSNLIKNYTDDIVTLEAIVNGTVLEQLTQFQVRTKHLYTNWLDLQNGRF